ncbi:phosphate ABC transporter ATP-binding protein [Tateyamaria omphalii]|uniref:phosphate ABC transporter ATP-binding protein n=1 Tax=Tateyamaria omphalii TaxID=299262 RepID=UPI001C9921B9|nr:phosphate ABC transporter ATP-binding protein [Tateyamaria omphalii]MBY5934544.1 phosphate ABC transporter ATP-binding protein [Tateyamaria omphalii]
MFDTQTTGLPSIHALRRNSPPIVTVRNLSLHYGEKQALDDVSFDLYPGEILAFIGPSGCGKSTALKCLNRMHDDAQDVLIEGTILMNGDNIHGPDIDPPLHRRRFGWVAQKPNPFPTSIFENVAYPARLHGLTRNRKALKIHVEQCLRRAGLWDEVVEHLTVKSGTELSGGQQQRLCVARALSTSPEVLLMDEPTGSIDPIATQRIEDLLLELKRDQAIVIITHSMAQARRIADRVAYFHLGKLLELQPTEAMFTAPRTTEARAFIAGKMG